MTKITYGDGERAVALLTGNPAVFGLFRRSVALRPHLAMSLPFDSVVGVDNMLWPRTMSHRADICGLNLDSANRCRRIVSNSASM